jgi:hypothetical protein
MALANYFNHWVVLSCHLPRIFQLPRTLPRLSLVAKALCSDLNDVFSPPGAGHATLVSNIINIGGSSL